MASTICLSVKMLACCKISLQLLILMPTLWHTKADRLWRNACNFVKILNIWWASCEKDLENKFSIALHAAKDWLEMPQSSIKVQENIISLKLLKSWWSWQRFTAECKDFFDIALPFQQHVRLYAAFELHLSNYLICNKSA